MRTVIHSQAEARNTAHKDGVFFECSRCRQIKPVGSDCGTGYGYDNANAIVCYACCGQTDEMAMTETGKATFYLSNGEVTNWPGTLRFKVLNTVPFHHPFARRAVLAYFMHKGRTWSAKNIGDSQIAHCRRLKA